MPSSLRHGPRLVTIAFLATTLGLAGCATDDGIEGADESEVVIKERCVQSNFNCMLPDHPHDHEDRNRFFTQTGSVRWSVKPGTLAVDGRGQLVGPIVSDISINFGQRKQLNGKSHVFGFSFKLADGKAASAWVEESQVPGDTARMPTVVHGDPGTGDAETFTIEGGDRAKYKDSAGRNFKISPGGVGNLEANDYLMRETGVVHVLYSVPGFQIGGLATDTYLAGRGVRFARAKGVKAITVPTYAASGGGKGPDMAFVYGHVDDRWGWIAFPALQPVPPVSGPAPGR